MQIRRNAPRPRSDPSASPRLIDEADLRIQGTWASNAYFAEFAREGSRCMIRANRWMPVSAIACCTFIAAVMAAAAWASWRWLEDPHTFLWMIAGIGTFTVLGLFACLFGTYIVLRRLGPWLTADLDAGTVEVRLAGQTFTLRDVEGLILTEGWLGDGESRSKMHKIKLVVEGRPVHVYSQPKYLLGRNVAKVAKRFGEATNLPVRKSKVPEISVD